MRTLREVRIGETVKVRKLTGEGVGTGSSITIIGSGICLVITAVIMLGIKKIRNLENVSSEHAVLEAALSQQPH